VKQRKSWWIIGGGGGQNVLRNLSFTNLRSMVEGRFPKTAWMVAMARGGSRSLGDRLTLSELVRQTIGGIKCLHGGPVCEKGGTRVLNCERVISGPFKMTRSLLSAERLGLFLSAVTCESVIRGRYRMARSLGLPGSGKHNINASKEVLKW
jgi:hypothetical protein